MRMEYRPTFLMVVLCALSLSLGWGVRGNFGHEYGAMIPGALAALAGVLAAPIQQVSALMGTNLILVVFAYGMFYSKTASIKQESLTQLKGQLEPLQKRNCD